VSIGWEYAKIIEIGKIYEFPKLRHIVLGNGVDFDPVILPKSIETFSEPVLELLCESCDKKIYVIFVIPNIATFASQPM
jgi:hypothetical protein